MNSRFAFFILKLPMAMSMLGHGLVRLPKLNSFAEGMAEQFKDSMLPDFLVLPFGYLLPLVELVIGILLLTNWQTKNTIYAGLLTMSLLIFGSSMIENWGAITAQLVHAIYFAVVLYFLTKNELATYPA